MFKIKTMNAIAAKGIAELTAEGCAVSADETAPDALLIRSAKLHDAVFNDELLCIGRAGIGVDNIPVERAARRTASPYSIRPARMPTRSRSCCCALSRWPRATLSAR